MSDYELLYLKFKKRFSTQQLISRLPRQKKRITEVALLDVNGRVLHKLIHQKAVWNRLHVLKKKYRRLVRSKRAQGEPVMILRERRNGLN